MNVNFEPIVRGLKFDTLPKSEQLMKSMFLTDQKPFLMIVVISFRTSDQNTRLLVWFSVVLDFWETLN